MTKIKIKNLSVCITFLSTICKIIPSAKFELSNKSCKVNGKSESNVCRAYLETDSIIANIKDGEFITFSFNNIIDLLKSLKLIENIDKPEDAKEFGINLTYDGYALRYKGGVKFKLNTCKSDIVDMYFTEHIVKKLLPDFNLNVQTPKIKTLLSCVSIASIDEDNETKIYFEKNENGDIIGSVDDKSTTYSNMLGLPIGEIESKDTNMSFMCLKIDALRSIILLEADNIQVTKIKGIDALMVNSIIENENSYIKAYMVIQLLKNR